MGALEEELMPHFIVLIIGFLLGCAVYTVLLVACVGDAMVKKFLVNCFGFKEKRNK
jgi:hypothetical protein